MFEFFLYVFLLLPSSHKIKFPNTIKVKDLDQVKLAVYMDIDTNVYNYVCLLTAILKNKTNRVIIIGPKLLIHVVSMIIVRSV